MAYVPSPSFSSCWKADGLFLLILAALVLLLLAEEWSFWSRIYGIVRMP